MEFNLLNQEDFVIPTEITNGDEIRKWFESTIAKKDPHLRIKTKEKNQRFSVYCQFGGLVQRKQDSYTRFKPSSKCECPFSIKIV
jgi:hypothetical protein